MGQKCLLYLLIEVKMSGVKLKSTEIGDCNSYCSSMVGEGGWDWTGEEATDEVLASPGYDILLDAELQ